MSAVLRKAPKPPMPVFDPDDDESEIPDDPCAFNSGLASVIEADEGADDEQGEVTPDDATTPSIDEGDFVDPAMHFLFRILKKHIREACNVNSKPAPRDKAMEWVFVPGTKGESGVEFEAACRALGARPDVVRIRVEHQLWKRGVVLSKELPFLSVPFPVALVSEIEATIGAGEAADIAASAWRWPSVPVMTLRNLYKDVNDGAYKGMLSALIEEGYLGITAARAYFIGRNPAKLSRAARDRFSFSASIRL